MPTSRAKKGPIANWTFLSNHTHVLLCIAQDPEMRVREMADHVGITERAIATILDDLEDAGYIARSKVGRRNRYKVYRRGRLRHPLESQRSVGELLDMIGGRTTPRR